MIQRLHKLSQLGWRRPKLIHKSVLIREICGRNAEDHSIDLDAWGTKIQKRSPRVAVFFEVVEQLRLLFGCQSVQGFDFDDNVCETGEACAIGCFERLAFVSDWQCELCLEWNSTRSEFDFQNLLMDRFEKGMSERTMNLHRGANDLSCFQIFRHEQ